jgi:hypothetical protein
MQLVVLAEAQFEDEDVNVPLMANSRGMTKISITVMDKQSPLIKMKII